jgi:GNAT superfamily N-acetyltransferase
MSPLLHEGWRNGLIAETIRLHMDYYGSNWGFGVAFEAKLAADMGEFHARLDPARDLALSAWGADGRLLGAVTLDGSEELDHLRWFVVAEAARGVGLGKALMARAVERLNRSDRPGCYLTTFAGLDAARALYERHGFVLVAEEAADPWSGGSVGLQRFERWHANATT